MGDGIALCGTERRLRRRAFGLSHRAAGRHSRAGQYWSGCQPCHTSSPGGRCPFPEWPGACERPRRCGTRCLGPSGPSQPRNPHFSGPGPRWFRRCRKLDPRRSSVAASPAFGPSRLRSRAPHTAAGDLQGCTFAAGNWQSLMSRSRSSA